MPAELREAVAMALLSVGQVAGMTGLNGPGSRWFWNYFCFFSKKSVMFSFIVRLIIWKEC